MKIKSFIVLFLCIIFLASCATTHTLNEEGRSFTYQKEPGIIIGKTTKRDIVSTYGMPSNSSVMGKYEVLTYSYSKKSFKTGGVGSALLGAVPVVGLIQSGIELSKDQGKDDTIREWQKLQVYVELASGIVKDYFYHDSQLNGHDESESLLLKSMVSSEQKKNDEALKLLEKAIELNPDNHRALNSLAWYLIDLGIDVDKGTKLATRAVEVFPDSPHNNGTLGVGYFKKGDLANAEKYLQTAIDLYPIYAPRDFKGLQYDKAMLQTVRSQKKR